MDHYWIAFWIGWASCLFTLIIVCVVWVFFSIWRAQPRQSEPEPPREMPDVVRRNEGQ